MAGALTGPTAWVRTIAGLAAVGTVLASATTFTVREGHAALVARFGDVVSVVDEPGLHLRLPWPIDEAIDVDLRTRVFESGHAEMLTADRKNVILVSYTAWKVADPLVFHRAVGSVEAADDKLDGLVTNATIGVLGRYDLSALVSTNPDDLRLDTLRDELLAATVGPARDKYGLEIVDLGFTRVSLPEANVKAVFEQMKAERARFAARYEAEGKEEAARIRSEADLTAARLLAEATETAAKTRGQAEADAARIYAEAHRRDPELYRFVRSLQSLDELVGPESEVILRTDSAPFELLERR